MDHGGNLNVVPNGVSPLSQVCARKNLEAARVLVQACADSNAKMLTMGGQCLLQAAGAFMNVPHHSISLIGLLVDAGADINGRNDNGETPLDLASNEGIIDKFDHTLHYSMAAQYPPALLVQEDGKVQSLGLVGKPLGLFADAEYVSATVEFSLGSTLCVFSDGVLDCLEPSDLVEKEQSLADKLAKTEALSALWKELEAANPGRDDMCLMAVKRQR